MTSTSSEMNDEVAEFSGFARLKTVRIKVDKPINQPNHRKSMFAKEFQPLNFNSIQFPGSKASQFMETSHLRKVLLSKKGSSKSMPRHHKSPKKTAYRSTKRIRHLASLSNLDNLQTPRVKSTTRKSIFPQECSSSLLPKYPQKEPSKFKQVGILNVKEYLLKNVNHSKEPQIIKKKPKNKKGKEPIVQDTKFSRELEYYANRQKDDLRNYFDKTKKNGQNLFKALRLKPNLTARGLQKLQCGYAEKKSLDIPELTKIGSKIPNSFKVTKSAQKNRKKYKIPNHHIPTSRTRTAAKKGEKIKFKVHLGGRKMSQEPHDSFNTPKIPELVGKKSSRSGFKKGVKRKLVLQDSYLGLTPLQLLQSPPSARTMTTRVVKTSHKKPTDSFAYGSMFL